MNLLRHVSAAIRGYRGNQSGVTAPIVAIMFTGLVGMAGYAIDMGHVMWVQRQLQASADAAALAGALVVADSASTGQTTATSYSGSNGQKNMVMGASSITTTVTAACLTATWVVPACGDTTSKMNSIVVTQSATVPTYFLKIFGLNNFTPTAMAKAAAKGGSGNALNVMVVLDATPSMTATDSNCTGEVADPNHPITTDPKHFLSSPTKMQCAQAGAAALLSSLNTATSHVGFMTFPPVSNSGTNSGRSADTQCGGTLTGGEIESYKGASSPTGSDSPYLLVGLTGSFTSASSAAQILAGNGVPSGRQTCNGIQAEPASGGQYTYFADAIGAAQAALPAITNAQNVIILLSDGDSNSPATNLDAGKANNQCQQAVNKASTATGDQIWVYAIAYGANSFGLSAAPPAGATIDNNINNNTVTVTNPTVTDAPVTTGSGTKKRISTTSHSTATVNNGGCSTDTTPPIAPCDTLKGIASKPGNFYSDGTSTTNTVTTTTTNTTKITNSQGSTNGITQPKSTTTTNASSTSTKACSGIDAKHTPTDIAEAFRKITQSLTQARLVPNSTT